jgi:hypothetical protein
LLYSIFILKNANITFRPGTLDNKLPNQPPMFPSPHRGRSNTDPPSRNNCCAPNPDPVLSGNTLPVHSMSKLWCPTHTLAEITHTVCAAEGGPTLFDSFSALILWPMNVEKGRPILLRGDRPTVASVVNAERRSRSWHCRDPQRSGRLR